MVRAPRTPRAQSTTARSPHRRITTTSGSSGGNSPSSSSSSSSAAASSSSAATTPTASSLCRLVGDCASVMPAEAPTLLVDDHRTLVYATARGEQGGHAEPLDAVDSALRGYNNTTIITVVGSSGNRTARLCAPACQGGDGAHRWQRPLLVHRLRRQPRGALGERAAAFPPHPVAEGENAARSRSAARSRPPPLGLSLIHI